MEKNEDIVPLAVKYMCQNIAVCSRNFESTRNIPQIKTQSKSATFALKLQTNELVNKLNETVGVFFLNSWLNTISPISYLLCFYRSVHL